MCEGHKTLIHENCVHEQIKSSGGGEEVEWKITLFVGKNAACVR